LPRHYGDGAYWQNAAIHARAMAVTFHDPAARLALLEVAIKYEALARHAHAQETGATPVAFEKNRKPADS
jgi:hypothetical protein